jgi:hypothetical protein
MEAEFEGSSPLMGSFGSPQKPITGDAEPGGAAHSPAAQAVEHAIAMTEAGAETPPADADEDRGF